MNGFAVSGWENFFNASAGASAALCGLLFVGLSINIARIVSTPGLTARAAETFIPLVVVLLFSLLSLVPGQSMTLFAWEVVLLGGSAWIAATVVQYRAIRAGHFERAFQIFMRLVFVQTATACVALSGLSLATGFPGGLYWLVPAVVFSIAGGLSNAWVLLVEILR